MRLGIYPEIECGIFIDRWPTALCSFLTTLPTIAHWRTERCFFTQRQGKLAVTSADAKMGGLDVLTRKIVK